MEKSVGAVIIHDRKYLVLKYGLGHWGFVKGHIEKDESDEETLFRETEEETGIKKEHLKIVDGFKEKISYYFKRQGKTIYKEVNYYLAESNTSDIKLSHEHKNYKWLDYENAIEQLSFKNTKKILKKANDFLQN